MATKTLVVLSHDVDDLVFSDDRRQAVNQFRTYLRGCNEGARPATTFAVTPSAVCASGTLTLSTSSGTIGATINGVSTTVAFSTDDTTTAALLAAAINASANALVAGHVTATSALGVVTVTAVLPGKAGNTITLAATGTGNTASGARLTGGTGTTSSLSF